MEIKNDDLNLTFEAINEAIAEGEIDKARVLMDYYGILNSRVSHTIAEECPIIPRSNQVVIRIDSKVSKFIIRTYGLTIENLNPSKKSDIEEHDNMLRKVDRESTDHKIVIVGFGSFVKDLKIGANIPIGMVNGLSRITTDKVSNSLKSVAMLLKDLKPNDPLLNGSADITDYFMVDSSNIKGTTCDKG